MSLLHEGTHFNENMQKLKSHTSLELCCALSKKSRKGKPVRQITHRSSVCVYMCVCVCVYVTNSFSKIWNTARTDTLKQTAETRHTKQKPAKSACNSCAHLPTKCLSLTSHRSNAWATKTRPWSSNSCVC